MGGTLQPAQQAKAVACTARAGAGNDGFVTRGLSIQTMSCRPLAAGDTNPLSPHQSVIPPWGKMKGCRRKQNEASKRQTGPTSPRMTLHAVVVVVLQRVC
jgi:hypothetical protein